MRRKAVLILLPFLLGQGSAEKRDDAGGEAARVKRERLMKIYLNEASGYTIFRDASKKERVELVKKPVYLWTNPLRNGGQDGAVFVWTCRGRAEVVGTFFSFPAVGERGLYHEQHSLATTVLDVTRVGAHEWHPELPGITPTPIPDAPTPGQTATQRLAQMRTLTHEFSANTVDKDKKRWELRLLPQPLYRYESTDPDVVDGAVFAFVTSSGTDPEVLLVLEARKPAGGGDAVWQYAIGRFTDQAAWARHKGKEVFTAPDIPYGTDQAGQDPTFRYTSFCDRQIPPVEDDTP